MPSETDALLLAINNHIAPLAAEIRTLFIERQEKPTTMVMACLLVVQREVKAFEADAPLPMPEETHRLLEAIQDTLDRMVAARINRQLWERRPRG